MVEEVADNPPEGGSVETGEVATPAAAATPNDAPLLAGGGSETPVAAPASWPENWREEWASGDDKALKRLARFTDPKSVAKSYFELEKKLSTRPTAPTIPENATPEQVAEYRKAIGVPDEGKYDVELGGGRVWADTDKAVLDDFQKHAYEANMPAGEFKKALAWYASWQERTAAQAAEMDHSFRAESEEALREEWGPDFRRNVNAINSLFATMPGETRNALFSARMSDGRLIGDSPDLVRFFSNLAREVNPAATLVPAGGGDPSKGVADRIGELEKIMEKDRRAWFANPAYGEEYDRLIEARNKMKAR